MAAEAEASREARAKVRFSFNIFFLKSKSIFVVSFVEEKIVLNFYRQIPGKKSYFFF